MSDSTVYSGGLNVGSPVSAREYFRLHVSTAYVRAAIEGFSLPSISKYVGQLTDGIMADGWAVEVGAPAYDAGGALADKAVLDIVIQWAPNEMVGQSVGAMVEKLESYTYLNVDEVESVSASDTGDANGPGQRAGDAATDQSNTWYGKLAALIQKYETIAIVLVIAVVLGLAWYYLPKRKSS